jgi:hypothetical protein
MIGELSTEAVAMKGKGRYGMSLKRVAGAMALAIGMTLAGLGVSTPAFAARSASDELKITFETGSAWVYQGTVDNGNRTIKLTSKGRGFHIDFYEYNTAGDMYKLYVQKDASYIWYLPQPVSYFRLCGPNSLGGDWCTAWKQLDP